MLQSIIKFLRGSVAIVVILKALLAGFEAFSAEIVKAYPSDADTGKTDPAA